MQPQKGRSTRENGASSQKVYAEIEAVKDGLGQLRSDVVELFDHALGVGRRGAEFAKSSATDRIADLKQRVTEMRDDSVSALERKIVAHPFRSTLIAFCAGYLYAKFSSRR
jgi:hypothetical protein